LNCARISPTTLQFNTSQDCSFVVSKLWALGDGDVVKSQSETEIEFRSPIYPDYVVGILGLHTAQPKERA